MKKKFSLLLASLFLTIGAAWAQNVVGVLGEPTTTLTDGKYVLMAMSEKGNGVAGPCFYNTAVSGRNYQYDLNCTLTQGSEVLSKYVWIVDETTIDGVQHITITNYDDNTKFFPADGNKNQNFAGTAKASLKTELKTIGDRQYFALTLDNTDIGYIHANEVDGVPNLSYWNEYNENGTCVKFVFYPVKTNIYTIDMTTGIGLEADNWKKDWAFTTTESHPAALKLTHSANNMTFTQGETSIKLYVGQQPPYDYTLSVPSAYKIVSYSFDFVRTGDYGDNDATTLTIGENTYTPSAEKQTVEVANVNASSTKFTLTGSNKGIVVTNFKVTVDMNVSKPGERKSTFAVGDEMYIYSTCHVNGTGSDYSGFLTNQNNGTVLTKTKPHSYVPTTGADMIWVVASAEEKTTDDGKKYYQVQLKNKATGGYFGIGGATNNATAGDNQTLNISQWNNAVLNGDTEKAGSDVWSEKEDGTALQQSEIADDAAIFAVQAGNNQCMNTNNNRYNDNRVAYPIIFYTVKDAQEEVSAKIDALNGVIPPAESLLATTGLSISPIALQVTNPTGAGYIKCNNLDPDEGNDMAYLLDNNPLTFIHSNWHDKSSEKDYLEVYLGEGKGVSLFRFSEITRSGASYDFAASIEILGSKDGESFVPVTTVKGLPTTAGASYTSPVIECDPSYIYLRFVVTGSNYAANRPYFHMAEFDLYSIETNKASVNRAFFYVALNDEIAKAKEYIKNVEVANIDASKTILENFIANNSKTYPFALKTDEGAPVLYAIKSGRTNANKGWWYTYDTSDGKIALTQFTKDDKQYWYFKEAVKNGNLYLELYPKGGDGSAMSYANTNNTAGNVVAASKQSGNYSSLWQLELGSNGKYGLQTENKETRLSNNGGVMDGSGNLTNNKMGMWNAGPDNDGGSAMYLFAEPKFPKMTTDDEKPVLYSIRSKRGNDHWFTYLTEGDDAGKINLQAYTGSDAQLWYFKMVVSDKCAHGLQLFPYLGGGKAMGYPVDENGNPQNEANNVVAQETGNITWSLKVGENGEYALQTEDLKTYLSHNGGGSNKMGLWWEGMGDPGTPIYLHDVAEELKEQFDELVVIARAYVSWMYYGRYTYEDPAIDATTLGLNIEAIDLSVNDQTTIAVLRTKIQELEEIIDKFNIRKVESGFYYFVNYDYNDAGEYLSDDRKTDNNTQRILTTEVTEKNIFYYNGQALMGYASGFGFEHSVCNTMTPGKMSTFTFGEAYEIGKYTVMSKLGTSEGNAQYADNCYWMNKNGELERTSSAADASGWDIIPVDKLPVAISSLRHATFYAPVAVTIPEGVKAYTGVVRGDWLTLTELEGTIPAETAVVLIAQEAGTYDFTIVESEAEANESSEAAIESNHLKGTTHTIVNDKKDADEMYYTLQKHEEKGVAFRKYAGDNLNGFRAYLELPEGTNAAALGIRFAGETTDIENSTLNSQLSTEIYDLTGRRIEKVVEKGIYIVNGKKVVIK